MKKKRDPGLLYLNELSMNKHRSYDKGMQYLDSKIGEEKVAEFEGWIHKRGMNEKLEDEIKFYDFKNQTLEMSLAISEVFDADYIRNLCNWICANQKLFGKRILDIGCDCGIITCFIAECFPEAKVVGIDRSEKSIRSAKELANKLALKNTTFIHADVNCFDGEFDTVISSRVTQENFAEKDISVFNTFFNISELYKQQIESIIGKTTSLLANNGYLISFELVGLNPLYYAILRTIVSNGCEIIGTGEIAYTELDDHRSASVLISKHKLYLRFNCLFVVPQYTSICSVCPSLCI